MIGAAVLLVLTVVGVVTGSVQKASFPGLGELIFGKPLPPPRTPPTTERPAPTVAPFLGASWEGVWGGPAPGCGTSTVDIQPETIRGVPNHGIRVNHEARRQPIKDQRNYLDWGDGVGYLPLADFVGPTHTYDRRGTYTVQIAVPGVCYDRGAANCENRCDAGGTAFVEIRR